MSTLTPNPDELMYCPQCERMFPHAEVCPADGARLVSLIAQRDPFIGRDLDGRYVVAEKLGQGGMGAVYRATQTSVGREVAIKVVNPAQIGEPEVIKRFLREAKLASKLNHPNAVAVVDFGQTRDGVFYLVMELIRGRTLAQIIMAEKRIAPERVIAIGVQVLSALEGAHAVPIVHRDLKPPNVMVGDDDVVKVLDFGIAKSISPDTVASTMTNAGALLGTPHFMPPEIANGKPFDGRADLYSLGCILYLLVEGRLPFDGKGLPDLLHQHTYEPVPPLTAAPRGLARVIEKLLAKDPDRRYATATVARAALERALSATPEELAAPTEELSPADILPPTGPLSAVAARFHVSWPLLVGAVIAVAAGIGAAVLVGGGGPAVPAASTVGAPAAPVPAPEPTPSPPPTPAPTPSASPASEAAAGQAISPASPKPAVVGKGATRPVRSSTHVKSGTRSATHASRPPTTDPAPPF